MHAALRTTINKILRDVRLLRKTGCCKKKLRLSHYIGAVARMFSFRFTLPKQYFFIRLICALQTLKEDYIIFFLRTVAFLLLESANQLATVIMYFFVYLYVWQ